MDTATDRGSGAAPDERPVMGVSIGNNTFSYHRFLAVKAGSVKQEASRGKARLRGSISGNTACGVEDRASRRPYKVGAMNGKPGTYRRACGFPY